MDSRNVIDRRVHEVTVSAFSVLARIAIHRETACAVRVRTDDPPAGAIEKVAHVTLTNWFEGTLHCNVWFLHGVEGNPNPQLQHGSGQFPVSQLLHEHPASRHAHLLQFELSHPVPQGEPNVSTYPGV